MTDPSLSHYTDLFQKCAAQPGIKKLKQIGLELSVGWYKDAVFLKLYKKEWANTFPDPLTAPSRIFFSVWVTPESVAQKKLWYNIHALKLRKLAGYRIESRKFAAAFRSRFAKQQEQWPNLRTDFGPLTLMEGWAFFDEKTFLPTVAGLTKLFLPVTPLIDETLALFQNKA